MCMSKIMEKFEIIVTVTSTRRKDTFLHIRAVPFLFIRGGGEYAIIM